MEKDLILAVDAGTQSVRAAFVDKQGEVRHIVKTAIEPYFSTQPGWAEQHADYYWEKLCETTRRLFAESGVDPARLAALTITTQRSTAVNVDAEGKPLRPAIVWMDQRKADAARIIPRWAVPALKLAGLHGFLTWVVQYCRSNWIRQNEPEIWAKTHKLLMVSGFLTHRFTGAFKDSAGAITGTIPYDVKRFGWAAKRDLKWRLFPVEPEKLPELVMPGEHLGAVTADAAAATGVPAGLSVIAASNDKACDVLGAGCLTPEKACVSFGTTATLNTQNERYVELRPMLPPYPSAIPQQYYSEVMVVRGLWMVTWFKEEFGLHERMLAEQGGVSPEQLLENLLNAVPAGSMGLICQPYWMPGPEIDPFAKGAVIGFGDVHNRAYLYRAIIEGIVYALKEGGDLTQKKNGVPFTEIRATGGGSQSDAILQITADVFDLPVRRPHTNETSLVGAAIDAAVGLGWYADFPSAVAGMTRVRQTFTPIPENVRLYRELFGRVYQKMYKQLAPLYREIQAVTGYPEI